MNPAEMASFLIQPHSRTPTPSSLLSALKRLAFTWKTQTASFPCATLLPLAGIISKFETSIPVSASADPPLQVARHPPGLPMSEMSYSCLQCEAWSVSCR